MASAAQRRQTTKAILTRLLFAAVSLLFISLVTFLADEIAPGDAALTRAGEKATAEDVARIRKEMGLDRPWPIRYVEFLGQAARFDFGDSLVGTQQPINATLIKGLAITMKIATMAILLAAVLGIFMGVLAAIHENKFWDRVILSFSTLGVTIPNYVLLPLLVLLLAVQGGHFPTSYEPPDRQQAAEFFYIFLPVFVLALRPMATLTRLMRASMVDTLKQEYVRLAIAKGVPRLRLYFKHCFRNALIPVLTAIGTSFGYLLTGSFVVETIYLVPGIGKAAIEAIMQRDTPTILAATLVTGALFVFVNLIVDILLPLVDPRIRESQV
ncbi:ABC transporter permease [Kamptonema cortianum]|nr:ABC transporter permease [Geitlerinema splendidum]MDK3156215.1 ABC transporter permease [Kamptonema cortianum]